MRKDIYVKIFLLVNLLHRFIIISLQTNSRLFLNIFYILPLLILLLLLLLLLSLFWVIWYTTHQGREYSWKLLTLKLTFNPNVNNPESVTSFTFIKTNLIKCDDAVTIPRLVNYNILMFPRIKKFRNEILRKSQLEIWVKYSFYMIFTQKLHEIVTILIYS